MDFLRKSLRRKDLPCQRVMVLREKSSRIYKYYWIIKFHTKKLHERLRNPIHFLHSKPKNDLKIRTREAKSDQFFLNNNKIKDSL